VDISYKYQKNSLHKAHSLQVTKGQGVEAKAEVTIVCVLELSSRSRTVLEDSIHP